MLASVFRHAGILPRSATPEAARSLASPARGGLLCQAYEIYRAHYPVALLSFERAVFLLGALWRGEELALGTCRDCNAVLVTDRWSLRAPRCIVCEPQLGRPLSCDSQ